MVRSCSDAASHRSPFVTFPKFPSRSPDCRFATIGAAIIALSNSPNILYLGSAIAGFGLAPQYPIFVTWLAGIFKQDSSWIGALFFGSAGIGGGALPWLVGIVSFSTNSLRAGLLIPLASRS